MIRFELRAGKDGMGILQIRVVGNGVNTKVSTGIKIKEKEWCGEVQQLRHGNDMRPQASLNNMSYSELSERLMQLRRALDVLDHRGEATSETVKEQVVNVLYESDCVKKVDVQRDAFVRYIEHYVDEMQDGSRTLDKTHEKPKEYYCNMFRRLRDKIMKYQEEKKVNVGWGSLTKTFYEKFCTYLYAQGLKRNTVALYSELLQLVVKSAIKAKLVTCDTDINEWVTTTELTDSIALSEERLDELYSVDLKDGRDAARLVATAKTEDKAWVAKKLKTPYGRRRLQEAINLFLLGCFTGQRYSDAIKIRKSNICRLSDGNEYIHIRQQKTGKYVYIPVDPRAVEVLERGTPIIDSKKLNIVIKDAGRVMGWTELTTFEVEENGIKYQSQKKYYEYLQSHTARRTFASLAYKRGVPLQAIMAVTGHSNEEMLKRYIRVNEEEKAMMASRELFQIRISQKA